MTAHQAQYRALPGGRWHTVRRGSFDACWAFLLLYNEDDLACEKRVLPPEKPPMTLTELATLTRDCRTAQRRYFRSRETHDLEAARRLEVTLDNITAEILAPIAAQKELFAPLELPAEGD